MNFEEVLNQAIALIERQGRVSYRALARQFELDELYLEDLKTEIVDVLQLATDEGGKLLVWAGGASAPRAVNAASATEPPVAASTDSAPKSASSASSAPVAPVAPAPIAASARAKPVAATPASTPMALVEPEGRQAERRQLTLMFCDLVDSTTLSTKLDPEDLRDVVQAYQSMCATVVQRFDGHIAHYLGDGIVVYFGYPSAHEDSGWRAMQSSLELVAGLDDMNRKLIARYGVALAVRVGVHTGQVVVGEMGAGGRRENMALGDTPNIAARIQALAQPNTVWVSETTLHLAPNRFKFIAQGSPALKGVTQPIELYQVLEGDAAPRAAVRRTELVGRKSEALLLQARWTQSHDGRGQAVVLSGEPGIGKSRLVDGVRAQALAEGAQCIEWQCAAHHANNALYPVIQHFERFLGLERGDTALAKFEKIEQFLTRYAFANERSAPLLARMLSVPVPEHVKAAAPNPQQDKQQTLELLTDWLIESAGRNALLFVVEDLQWGDPSTIELLSLVLDQVPTASVLALLTCRPEFQAPWAPRQYLSFLTLDRLTKAQTEVMITTLMGGARLPEEVVQQIVVKTDGIPLFVEELVKMLMGSDLLSPQPNGYGLRGPLPELAIPSTLQDSLMARLDRLSSTRETAQLAATIGREFSFELIRAVSPLDEATLRLALSQLAEAELIYRRGSAANTMYLFKHAMILDAAYQSLLKSRRQIYHQKIALVLEAQFPTTRDTQPELLAHHFSEAGQIEQAVDYWHKAGQRSIQRSANIEAIASLSRGLELVDRLPEGLPRVQRELDLRVAIGIPLVATKGYAAADVERTYTRAQELSLQVEESPQLPNIIWGLWVFYLTGGPLDTAIRIAEQYRELAEKRQETPLLLETCQLIGIPSFYMGEFAKARPILERGAAMYDAALHHSLVFEHGGADTGVAIMTHEALTVWALGQPDRARERMAAAMACARSLSHPFTMAFVLYYHAWLEKLCGDDEAVRVATAEAVGICDEHGFPFWGLSSAALRGSTWTDAASAEEGIAAMKNVLALYAGAGAELCRPSLLCLMAQALAATGQPQQGLDVLTEALAAMDKGQERWWQAEAHRLRGELLLMLEGDHTDEVEAAFEEALAVAKAQQSPAWTLRAASSLLRHRSQAGEPTLAQTQALSLAYGRFSEGFETADLRQAKVLLKASELLAA